MNLNNLPKLSNQISQNQARPQFKRNSIIQQNAQTKKPSTASQTKHLSPFTWTNIKLPAVLMKEKAPKLQKINPQQIAQKKIDLNKKQFNTIDPSQIPSSQTIKEKQKSKIKQKKESKVNNQQKIVKDQKSRQHQKLSKKQLNAIDPSQIPSSQTTKEKIKQKQKPEIVAKDQKNYLHQKTDKKQLNTIDNQIPSSYSIKEKNKIKQKPIIIAKDQKNSPSQKIGKKQLNTIDNQLSSSQTSKPKSKQKQRQKQKQKPEIIIKNIEKIAKNQKNNLQQKLNKKQLNNIDPVQIQSLQTIKEKIKQKQKPEIITKNYENIAKDLKNNLHQKVVKQNQKRKFKSQRQNRSFSQKVSQHHQQSQMKTLNQDNFKNSLEINSKLKKLQKRYEQKNQHSNLVNIKLKKITFQQSFTQQNPKKYLETVNHLRRSIANGKSNKSSKSKDENKKIRTSSIQKFQYQSQLNSSILVKSSKNSSINKNDNDLKVYHEMQTYMRNYFLKTNKNQFPQKIKIFVTSNPKYHPLHQNQFNSAAFHKNQESKQLKNLIWTKNQNFNIFRQMSSNQYYNHVEGSHVLTSKQKLHELFLGGKGLCKSFYPISFSLPKQYNQFVEEYDFNLIKVTLKKLISFLVKKQKNMSTNSQLASAQQKTYEHGNVCLSDILNDLIQETKNQEQLKLLKLCLILQLARKKQNLTDFFQNMPNYRPVQIKLTQSIYVDVIQWCLQTKTKKLFDKAQNNSFINFEKIDYRLIQVLKAYNFLFETQLPHYLYKDLDQNYNMWMIKPFASSKAAGISLIFESQQFYTTLDYQYKQFRYKSKYHNKIFMKYISNPLIIKHSGLDYFVVKHIQEIKLKMNIKNASQENQAELVKQIKHINQLNQRSQRCLRIEEKFNGRKFDIRQWVLIVCEETQNQMKTKINQGRQIPTNHHFRNHSGNFWQTGRKSPKPIMDRKFKIYKYHTAYCRFANKQYSLDTKDLQTHLTNYELAKKSRSSAANDNRSLNSSILSKSGDKSQYIGSHTEQNNKSKDSKGNEKSDSKLKFQKKPNFNSNLASVLMLDELFQYIQFQSQIKSKNISQNKTSQQFHSFQKYSSQLDNILSIILSYSHSNLTFHSKTFELFGIDLLLDENMNLYLLQLNLNPGCSSDREDKLNKQAENMLDGMFQVIMKKQRSVIRLDDEKEKMREIYDDKIIHHEIINKEQIQRQVELKMAEEQSSAIRNIEQEQIQKVNQPQHHQQSNRDKWVLVHQIEKV